MDDSPSADSPRRGNATGPFFYFSMVASRADETVPRIAEAARRHAFVFFDPQEKLL
jgi:hypothetical protein